MKAFVDLLRRWWRGRNDKRVLAQTAFCDEGGVSQFDWLGDEEVHHRVAWDQVETVIAFPVGPYDVGVALLDNRGEVLASVSDASGSFGAFISGLPKWLSGCQQPVEWEDRVLSSWQTVVIFRRSRAPVGGG